MAVTRAGGGCAPAVAAPAVGARWAGGREQLGRGERDVRLGMGRGKGGEIVFGFDEPINFGRARPVRPTAPGPRARPAAYVPNPTWMQLRTTADGAPPSRALAPAVAGGGRAQVAKGDQPRAWPATVRSRARPSSMRRGRNSGTSPDLGLQCSGNARLLRRHLQAWRLPGEAAWRVCLCAADADTGAAECRLVRPRRAGECSAERVTTRRRPGRLPSACRRAAAAALEGWPSPRETRARRLGLGA